MPQYWAIGLRRNLGFRLALLRSLAGMTLLFLGFMANHNAHAADSAKIDPALCQGLVQHTPGADVAYQPGVDVHGRSVAPADLGGGAPSLLPAKINIPLTVSLAKVLNLDPTQYPTNQLGPGTEAQLGTLTVEGNHVTLNGQPLTNAQQDNLAVVCMKPDR